MTSKDWRKLRKAFQALDQRAGRPLRGFHQTGGWGRAERERLADPTRPALPEPVMGALQTAADAPPWYLDGPDAAVREFQHLAASAAALLDPADLDWAHWRNRILTAPLADDRIVSESDGARSALIRNLVQSSIACCRLLEAGMDHPPMPTDVNVTNRDASHTNRERVNAFLREASRIHGRRAIRADIWRTAGYTSRTEFERWQRDKRATAAARANFERVLSDPRGLIIGAR